MSASNELKQSAEAKTSKDESDVDPSKVHSANSWETADLGDDDRKKKFLRLMGASKGEHHGKIVIGDTDNSHTHARDKKDTEQIEKELEEQYKHTFEHRITKRSHKGLGFDDEKKESEEASKTSESENKTDSEEAKNKDTKSSEQVGKKRESSEPAKDPESPPKKPKMMMNFVKASD